MVQSRASRKDDIFALIDDLSLDEKMQVVGRLVGKYSGLSIRLDSQHDNFQTEVNLMPNRELANVLNAIAAKIRCY